MNENALPGNKPGSNRHIVDQLADVRQQIKKLEEKEKGLKARVSEEMGKADSLGGDEFIARQTVSERKTGLDEKAMKANGIDVERFRRPTTTVFTIRVEPRVQEEA